MINSWDTVWDDVFSSQEWGRYPSESLIRFIAGNYYKRNREEVRLLEVGCGTGASLWFMARERFDTYGIDASEVALRIARERMEKEGYAVKLSLGDIVALPYEDNFFDGVVDNECIYANNLANSRIILQEISRVLKPGGRLYSRTFSERMYLGKQQVKLGELEYTDISDGPAAGKGFTRLSTKESIKELYGEHLQLESIDILEASYGNGSTLTSEYIVIARK